MTNREERCTPQLAAELLWSERYPAAELLFCGGSVIRGEGYATSDLDVVVIFSQVPAAWRESFVFRGWPVEVFAHDPETLAYFVAADRERGRPAIAHMIADAIVAPERHAWSERIRAWAKAALTAPPARPREQLDSDRYALTDLLNDFRDDRSAAELVAIACELYPLAHRFALQARGHWSGSPKRLPILVREAAPDVAAALGAGFSAFFQRGERAGVVQAIELVLAPFGGELFAGYRSTAPASHRVARAEIGWLDHEHDTP